MPQLASYWLVLPLPLSHWPTLRQASLRSCLPKSQEVWDLGLGKAGENIHCAYLNIACSIQFFDTAGDCTTVQGKLVFSLHLHEFSPLHFFQETIIKNLFNPGQEIF